MDFHQCRCNRSTWTHTQAQINTSYAGTTLDGAVNINTQGIQEWTMPAAGTYKIEIFGAQGGNNAWFPGGLGAKMVGEFSIPGGSILSLVIGQKGRRFKHIQFRWRRRKLLLGRKPLNCRWRRRRWWAS